MAVAGFEPVVAVGWGVLAFVGFLAARAAAAGVDYRRGHAVALNRQPRRGVVTVMLAP